MAWYYYLSYLAVVFCSALLVIKVGKIKIDYRRLSRALFPVFLLFVLWDVVAVELGHWHFGLQYMTGLVLYNQPIDELAFFLVIPFIYVVGWEACKKKLK